MFYAYLKSHSQGNVSAGASALIIFDFLTIPVSTPWYIVCALSLRRVKATCMRDASLFLPGNIFLAF